MHASQQPKAATTVVISTYNRPRLLGLLLDSLAVQTVQPVKIIIVDQSGKREIKEAIDAAVARAGADGKTLAPIEHHAVDFQGLTRSRNYGLNLVQTPFTTFLDDDATVGPDYIKTALAFFDERDAFVVGGIQHFHGMSHKGPPPPGPLWGLYRRIFRLSRPGASYSLCDNFEIQYMTPPIAAEGPLRSDFISGSNFTVVTEIAKKVQFDEKLIWYSIGEDLDFPLRVRKLKPDSVWQDTRLEIYHPMAEPKPLSEFLLAVHTFHKYYLFFKMWDGKPGPKALLEFALSRVGDVLLPALSSRRYKLIPNYSLLRSSAKVELRALAHIKGIIGGSFPITLP